MTTIHAGSYGLRPAMRTLPGAAARMGVSLALTTSMPRWKWLQLP